MLPDRVSNPGPLTYESGALPIALHGPASPISNSRFGPVISYEEIKERIQQGSPAILTGLKTLKRMTDVRN